MIDFFSHQLLLLTFFLLPLPTATHRRSTNEERKKSSVRHRPIRALVCILSPFHNWLLELEQVSHGITIKKQRLQPGYRAGSSLLSEVSCIHFTEKHSEENWLSADNKVLMWSASVARCDFDFWVQNRVLVKSTDAYLHIEWFRQELDHAFSSLLDDVAFLSIHPFA